MEIPPKINVLDNGLLKYSLSEQVKMVLLVTLAIKVLLLMLFSSGYKEQLFIPFVRLFLEHGGDPYQLAMTQLVGNEFPYPPFMLYILSVFLSPVSFFDITNESVIGLLYGLPILLSDLLILYTLVKLYPWRKTEIYIFYFASPIVLFASYIHGQLDLIPTALMFFSIKLLMDKRFLWCAVLLGLSISTKFHTVAIIPLVLIYLLNQKNYRAALYVAVIPTLIYAFLVAPYIDSQGFQSLVIQNRKQELIFDTFIALGSFQLYLPIMAAMFVYLRFASFKKINSDLLFATAGTLFSVFLLLIVPAPGWFIWVVPFFTVFYIRYFEGYQSYYYYGALIFFYALFYLFFYKYDFNPVSVFGYEHNPDFDKNSPYLSSVIFTGLESVLLASIYQFYRSGIKSNQVYAMEQSFVLGVGGDSGSGKSTLLASLDRLLGKELLQLEGDGDHKWERGDQNWKTFTHLNPKANFLHKQAENISQLKSGEPIQRSDYDHKTGKFTKAEKIKPRHFLSIAGLHPFYLPKMRKVIDLKIFLDLDERLRVHWKVLRDTQKRGHPAEKVIESINARQADAQKYIHPQKKFSDVVVRYFPLVDVTPDMGYEIPLGLEVTIDASIPLEGFIKDLAIAGFKVDWDYSEDLENQILRMECEPMSINYTQLTGKYITNASELTDSPRWDEGFQGIVQFVLLYVISEKLKEKALKHV